MKLAAIGAAGAAGVLLAAVAVLALPVTAHAQAAQPADFPAWAYPWFPEFKIVPDDGVPRRVPDSSASYTITQERDLFFAPDWHPESHPPMPEVVARGRKPVTRACGSCHRSEGTGGPENSSLAGLPVAYFVQQMADFKSGARKFAGPQRSPVTLMNAIARDITDEETLAAAKYFSALKPKRNIKVIESSTAPKIHIARVFYALDPNGGSEPLGERIVEVPVDIEQFEHRDTRSQFLAYVPPGSIARGEALVKTGGGVTAQCATCHGADLKGAGDFPNLAGRSPSYLVRQLYDFKSGQRAGAGSAAMKPTVEKLSHADMIAIAAYVASLPP